MFLLVVGAVWLYLLWVNGALSPEAWGRWLLGEDDRSAHTKDVSQDFGEGGDF